MNIRTLLSSLLVLLCGLVSLAAQNVFITQVDAGQLLVTQKNRLYAHLLDAQGNPLEQPDVNKLAVYESADGKNFIPAKDLRLSVDSNKTQGIAFFFLMDNSGSMYDSLSGTKTENANETRIHAANKAATDFLLSVSGPADTVGLGVFNTRYQMLVTPTADRQAVAAGLDGIARPAREDGYTEMYAAIRQASYDLKSVKGRKALIVMTDGANWPYADYEKKPNPQFGDIRYRSNDAIEEAVREGWTVFAVNFGPDAKDSELATIARLSGGDIFDARDEVELAAIYRTIRDKILKEVLVEYSATMLGGDKRWVRLDYSDGAVASSERYYYVGTVFGQALSGLPWWVFLLSPLALLAWFILSLIKFDKPSLSANLSLLYAPGIGRGTKVFAMGNQTIIGGDATADVTIAGNAQLQQSPVTITKDTVTGQFTLLSSQTVSVNNKTVTTKKLEAGDVINFNGTIVVFDDLSPPVGRTIVSGAQGKAVKRGKV